MFLAAIEARLTMAPPPRALKVRERRLGAVERTLEVDGDELVPRPRHLSCRAAGRGLTPALLTSPSRPPWASAAASIARATASESRRSICEERHPGSDSVTCVASSRSRMVTLAPASQSARAVASPIPLAPPMTTAEKPLNSLMKKFSESVAATVRAVPRDEPRTRFAFAEPGVSPASVPVRTPAEDLEPKGDREAPGARHRRGEDTRGTGTSPRLEPRAPSPSALRPARVATRPG